MFLLFKLTPKVDVIIPDQARSQAFEMVGGGGNLGYNFYIGREAGEFFILVINGVNLGTFESNMGVKSREAAEILKIRNKLCKSRAFWIEMGAFPFFFFFDRHFR